MVEAKQAQDWLKSEYESKKSNETEIRVKEDTELQGKLLIKDYPKLKEIFLEGGKISELKIENCPAIETLHISDNEITKIEGLESLPLLSDFNFGGNKIEKIDVNGNTKIEMLNFRDNPPKLEFTNGIKNLKELISLYSYKTFSLTKFLDQAAEDKLKELAKEAGISVDGKTADEIKKAIKEEIEKNEQNKNKLNKDFPGLVGNDGKVDDNKLKEIKEGAGKGDEYQELVKKLASNEKNASVLDKNDKTKIDSKKLDEALARGNNYNDLTNEVKNASIVSETGSKKKVKDIDQVKLDDAMKKRDNYDNLVKDTNNAPILDANRKEVDQNKLGEVLKKSKEYDELVSKIDNLSGSNSELEKAVRKFFGPE